MPKNKLQDVVFTAIMVIVMVYGMVCYNIALDMGGLSNKVFLIALNELPIMCPVAFVLEMFIVGHISQILAFRIVIPGKDRPVAIILTISTMIILLMCPLMSFIACLLFKGGINSEIISTWIQTTILNYPMAFFWQLVVSGPLVRRIFGLIFREKSSDNEAEMA